jgi:hypothetical protein
MKAPLMRKESWKVLRRERRNQEREREEMEESIELTEKRRSELIATNAYLLKLQEKLEGTPFHTGVAEIKNLRDMMNLQRVNSKLVWSPQWGFNQVFRARERINYGVNAQWVRVMIKDLNFFQARMLTWGQV